MTLDDVRDRQSVKYGSPRRIDADHQLVTLGMLLVNTAIFFYRGFSYSILVFILIWISCILFLIISRLTTLFWERRQYCLGKGILRAAIVGSNRWGGIVSEKINLNTKLGISTVGHIGKKGYVPLQSASLGDINDIAKIAQKMADIPLSGLYLLLKRIFDFFFSVFVLMLLWPLFLITALLIKLDSKGTVFYKQIRVSMDGKEFPLLKFRTMIMGAEDRTGPVWAVKGDPRSTKIGNKLRRFGIDELPQLINIIRGEMSVVGPRPERPFFVNRFRLEIPKYLERYRVRSGMTGWAQIHGFRGDTPLRKRLLYDLYYVRNWSWWLDMWILLRTPWHIIKGENAY